MTQHPKPVIFLAFANEQDNRAHYLRKLPEEARRLRQTLDQAEQRDLAEIILRSNATLKEILDVFQDIRYRNRIAIFHYGGHADGFHLLLESASGERAAIDAGGLAAFLGRQTALQLVFLNGCSTQPQVEGLLAAGIPAVVATSQAIDDTVAMEFAARFYHGLANGAALRPAYDQAAAAIQATHGSQNLRGLYWGQIDQPADRWPWDFYLKAGAEIAADWNLPQAANDYLFGLPELPPLDLPPSPFRHLYWFEREHAPVFFGREQVIRELYQRIANPETAPLVLLYGQSGVGKSSLLAAGLQPRLEKEYSIDYRRRDPAQGLRGSLSAALQMEAEATAPGQRWRELEQTGGRPLVIILDQVEEVFTRPLSESGEFEDFLAALSDIFTLIERRPQGKLILGFRKEWLAEIEKRLIKQRLPLAKIFLERLDGDDIARVVCGPAQTPRLQAHYGLSIDANLPDLIANDLLADPESPIAPTLQILLTKLWTEATQTNPAHPHFRVELYQRLKKEGILLADFLDQQLDQLRVWQSPVETSGLALDLLAYHTTPLGTAAQHSRVELAETYNHQAELLPQLIQKCQDLYLLVDSSQNQPNQTGASQLAHDTLAPLVRRQFDESDRPGQRARRILESRAVEWDNGQTGAPLDKTDLTLVEHGQVGMRVWTEAEERLVQASRKERAKRKRDSVFRWVFGIFAVSLLAIAAIVAEQRRQDTEAARSDANAAAAEAEARRLEAEHQARINQARELAARAVNRLEEDPEESILLAMAAVTTTYNAGDGVTTEAEQALHQAVQASQIRYTLRVHTAGILDVALSPNDDLLATASRDGTSHLWNLPSDPPQEILLPLTNTTYILSAVAFSPNSSQLAIGNAIGEVQIWNIRKNPPQLLQNTFKPHSNWILDIAFSPDGKTLATVSKDGTAKLLDMATMEEKNLLKLDYYLCGVGFSRDGTYMAVGGDKGVVTLLRTSTGESIQEYTHDNDKGEVCAIAFSPTDDFLLATGGVDNEVKLWTLDSKQPLRVFSGHTSTIRRVIFSSDGERLATGSFDRTAKLWDVNSGRPLSTFSGHKDSIWAMAMSHDDQYLITAGEDKTVKIWSIGSYHQDKGNSVAITPNGSRLATTGQDGTTRVWSLPSGRRIARYSDQSKVTSDAVFYPDNTRLAIISEDGTIRVRDTNTGAFIIKPQYVDHVIYTVAINHDASLLAAAGEKKVFLLNPDTGQVITTSIPPYQSQVLALAFHPKQNVLASGEADNRVQIIDLNNYQVIKTLKLSIYQTIKHLAFSPTGQYLAAASGSKLVTVWDGETFQKIFEISGHDDEVSAVAFTSDSKYLITASEDKTVKIWDISAVTPGATLVTPRLVLPQPVPIRDLALTPDNSLVATIGDDGGVRFLPFLLDIQQMLNLAQRRVTSQP